jgi:hypothetical protein
MKCAWKLKGDTKQSYIIRIFYLTVISWSPENFYVQKYATAYHETDSSNFIEVTLELSEESTLADIFVSQQVVALYYF